jgi:hypothetical protein
MEKVLLLLGFSLILYLIVSRSSKEKFSNGFPFFNVGTRSTRNMSYDLRCEPRIQKNEYNWLNSSILHPKQYKCL